MQGQVYQPLALHIFLNLIAPFFSMIKTIVFFTAGGVFTALRSRSLMNLPLLYKPQLLALTTSVGGE